MLIPSSGDERHSRIAKPLALERIDPPAGIRNGNHLPAPPGTPRPGVLQKNWLLLKKLQKAKLVARQQGYGFPVSPQPAPELEALQQAARQGERQKSRIGLRDKAPLDDSGILEPLSSHAAPLSPLRERDGQALLALFQREDMLQIEADIADRLLHLLPEPCWEDNPFEFIREFL